MAAPGWVHVPWYATVFRADAFEAALMEIAPVAMRYGASSWAVYRSDADRYRFAQFAAFDSKLNWERYWYGEEFNRFRRERSSWYQVPVVYDWMDRVGAGELEPAPAPEV